MDANTPPLTDESVLAQREAALDSLQALVILLRKIGGYMTQEQQHALWNAQALVVESGRKI